jgi:hypothetical protein
MKNIKLLLTQIKKLTNTALKMLKDMENLEILENDPNEEVEVETPAESTEEVKDAPETPQEVTEPIVDETNIEQPTVETPEN